MEYDPETVRPYLTPDQYYALPADLEPVRRVADAARDVRRDDGRHRRRATTCSASRAPVPKFAGLAWRSTAQDARTRASEPRGPEPADASAATDDDDGAVGRAAAARRRRPARAEGAAARAEVHAAAAALHRSDAGEGARGERHRPAEHLRVDHRRAPGPRLREQDRRHGSSRRRSA